MKLAQRRSLARAEASDSKLLTHVKGNKFSENLWNKAQIGGVYRSVRKATSILSGLMQLKGGGSAAPHEQGTNNSILSLTSLRADLLPLKLTIETPRGN